METKDRVVVALPLVCLNNKERTLFVARIKALGLTAYGENTEDARLKVKQMFAKWVDLNRKDDTLESNLNKSGLTWYHENEYNGVAPYERVLSNGEVELVPSKQDNNWEDLKTLVVAS